MRAPAAYSSLRPEISRQRVATKLDSGSCSETTSLPKAAPTGRGPCLRPRALPRLVGAGPTGSDLWRHLRRDYHVRYRNVRPVRVSFSRLRQLIPMAGFYGIFCVGYRKLRANPAKRLYSAFPDSH
jgi:hypothetical protein